MRRLVLLITLALICSCGSVPDFDRNIESKLPAPTGGLNAPANSTSLRITALDVGQGDCTFIEAPDGQTMLIDTGPPGAGADVIFPFFESFGIDEITHVVLTHFHNDHTGGLAEVLLGADGEFGTDDDIKIKGGIYDHGEMPSDAAGALPDWIEQEFADIRQTVYAGDQFNFGDVHMEVVAAGARLANGETIDAGDPPDENAKSIVLLIDYAGFRMLIPGDVTGGGGSPPYQTPDIETGLAPLVGDIDVLRVAHHGSDTNTNETFLSTTTPEVAIISVGDENDYFHPHPSVIDRLINSGITVYQTERGSLMSEGPTVADGHITVEVDGEGEYRIVISDQ
ncbi:MAG: MBL fold metallo-hydrolase [Pseudomonadota bacterium]